MSAETATRKVSAEKATEEVSTEKPTAQPLRLHVCIVLDLAPSVGQLLL